MNYLCSPQSFLSQPTPLQQRSGQGIRDDQPGCVNALQILPPPPLTLSPSSINIADPVDLVLGRATQLASRASHARKPVLTDILMVSIFGQCRSGKRPGLSPQTESHRNKQPCWDPKLHDLVASQIFIWRKFKIIAQYL
ncbi:hypothetical protein RRG08_006269 [Elysia crispata]|uniref:Uncharacterized protein n=1 Tax=Elysia crispata TaxID=231223 RepID=A0AAE1D3B0_9GAST|nr:hypothetical protein RRG08_006269 [Elysia crispata]